MDEGNLPVGAAEDHREGVARRKAGVEGAGRKHLNPIRPRYERWKWPSSQRMGGCHRL